MAFALRAWFQNKWFKALTAQSTLHACLSLGGSRGTFGHFIFRSWVTVSWTNIFYLVVMFNFLSFTCGPSYTKESKWQLKAKCNSYWFFGRKPWQQEWVNHVTLQLSNCNSASAIKSEGVLRIDITESLSPLNTNKKKLQTRKSFI